LRRKEYGKEKHVFIRMMIGHFANLNIINSSDLFCRNPYQEVINSSYKMISFRYVKTKQ